MGERSFYVSLLIASAGLILTSCNKVEESCSSDDAKSVTISMIKDNIEKSAIEGADGKVSASAIRASLSQLKFDIEKIRTTKNDPNSTKKFCTGTAKIVVPINVIKDAAYTREAASLSTVEKLVEDANANLSADVISFDIDYDIQASDDKKTLFASSESIKPRMNMLGELINSAALKSNVDANKAAEKQQKEQLDAANQQAKQADHEASVQENHLSQQAIETTWNSIDPATRGQILNQQKAWVASKQANCATVALQSGLDATDRENARLKCDTAQNNERIGWLNQYVRK